MADSCVACGVNTKQATTMGFIPCAHVRHIDRSRKVSRSVAHGFGQNVEEDDGKVHFEGGWSVGK